MATTTTTTTSCTSFINVRRTSVEAKLQSSTSNGSSSCGKLDGVAMWVVNGVATAFFASLERCSCIHIPNHDEADEAIDLPLFSNHGEFRHENGTGNGRRTGGKGKKKGGFAED